MPLNARVFDPPITSVGNPATIGGNNQPFRREILTSFAYQINESDYYAGSVQFITTLELVLSLNNASRWIQSRDAVPIEYDLGSWSMNTSGALLERGVISSLTQTLVHTSRLITLDQSEAARAKLYRLSARPRMLISKSTNEGIPLAGQVRQTTFTSQLTGVISGIAPGAVTGTIGGTGIAPTDATVEYSRRQFNLDSTDGLLSFTTNDVVLPARLGSLYNSLGDRVQLRGIGVFLRPGITGTAKLTVLKTGETNSQIANPNPVYTPGAFPLL
jgi:hypothetical protein